jgi:hypothetical protein
MTKDELIRTFEGLAESQDASADRIEAHAGAGLTPELAEAVTQLREKAQQCRDLAQTIREGTIG